MKTKLNSLFPQSIALLIAFPEKNSECLNILVLSPLTAQFCKLSTVEGAEALERDVGC